MVSRSEDRAGASRRANHGVLSAAGPRFLVCALPA